MDKQTRQRKHIRLPRCGRRLVQAASALLHNGHLTGFVTGRLYTGGGKRFCVPGLNCYSCPGALGACPVGALQNALSAFRFRFPFYVTGFLLFFGTLLGRVVCGFLCPFGFLQDLLYHLPLPPALRGIRRERTFRGVRALRWVKYGVLLVLVLVLPLLIKATPFYCKYLCPSGTASGLLLLWHDPRLRGLPGGLFLWKLLVLAVLVAVSVCVFRPFCKYFCPLGAFYALFNRVAAVRLDVDAARCTQCGRCAAVCGMAVDPAAQPNATECIRCGACVRACPHHAIRWVHPLFPDRPSTEAASACPDKKQEKLNGKKF